MCYATIRNHWYKAAGKCTSGFLISHYWKGPLLAKIGGAKIHSNTFKLLPNVTLKLVHISWNIQISLRSVYLSRFSNFLPSPSLPHMCIYAKIVQTRWKTVAKNVCRTKVFLFFALALKCKTIHIISLVLHLLEGCKKWQFIRKKFPCQKVSVQPIFCHAG